MRRASLVRPRAPLAPLALLAVGALAACGGDDGGPPVDAAPGGPDAAPACTLPSTIITCTAGDDTPCTNVCGNAYCHLFNQVGTLCTQPCTIADDCPTGWSCNTMGRCRPP